VARIVEPTPVALDAIRAVLLELVKEPETRRALFEALAPELKSLLRTDPECRRIIGAYPSAGPPAPQSNPGPGLFASVLRRIQEKP
jgi:hypothetical protein